MNEPPAEAERSGDGFDVRSLATTYRTGHILETHTHPWAQLVYATSGVMSVEVSGQIWFVPSTKAVWIPARCAHRIEFRGEVRMRTLYIAPQRAAVITRGITALAVSPLLSQLIQHIQQMGMLSTSVSQHQHLIWVLTDLINAAPALDTVLPTPQDPRAVQLATFILNNSDNNQDLTALAKQVGASVRTLQRHFLAETGLTLNLWRQKAKLIHSLQHLQAGCSVTDTSTACGYDSTSAFIKAFKKHFGTTPGQYPG